MPRGGPGKPRRPYKTRRKAATAIQRAWRRHKNIKYVKRVAKPRSIISRNPLSSPNVYNFCRSYTYNVSIGVEDLDNLVYMNSDNKCMIIKLRTKVNKLPNFSEFESLFNQYQVTSIHHQMIPYYKDNVAFTKGDQSVSADYGVAVPNYQVYYIPENYTLDLPALHTHNMATIDQYLNESQRKAYRMFPSKQKDLWNKKPSIPDVGYDAKSGSLTPTEMITAPWMSTQSNQIELYGIQLVICRVDRKTLNSHNSTSNIFQNMGWRINNTVFFKTRKVQ